MTHAGLRRNFPTFFGASDRLRAWRPRRIGRPRHWVAAFVLILAVALAGEAARRRLDGIAKAHAMKAQELFGESLKARDEAAAIARGLLPEDEPAYVAFERASRRHTYLHRLAIKYWQAARRPWGQVPPDPPPPL